MLALLVCGADLDVPSSKDASSAPGTVSISGTSPMTSGPNGGEELTTWPVARISSETGVVPSTKNSRLPPGAKNGCTEALSCTRSAPKLTTPTPKPFGPAIDCFGQGPGPLVSITLGAQVANPCGCSFAPAGAKYLSPISGGGKPPYSVPEILPSNWITAPAPRMSPVPGKPGIGNAFVLNVNVGAADAMADGPRTARPSTAREVDILRKLAIVTMGLPVPVDRASTRT